MLVVAMLAMTLVGCGSDTTDTTNTTNDATVNTELEESGDDVVTEMPTEEPTTTPEVEEPTIEPTPEEVVDGENDTPMYAYSTTFVFPDDMEGFTRKYLNEDYSDWSVNETHYVDTNGNEMNFEWEGPASLGESVGAGEKVLTLIGVNCELRAWTYGYVDGDYESCLEMDKETWTGFAPDDVPYVVDGYYNVETTEDVIKVVFAVENDNYKGYNCYITDSTNAICYQFAYHEDIETYDDARAMNVINSIAYWEDYTPLDTTTE